MKDLKQLIKDKKILEAKALILSNMDSIEESIDIVLGEIEIESYISIRGQIIESMSEKFEFEYKQECRDIVPEQVAKKLKRKAYNPMICTGEQLDAMAGLRGFERYPGQTDESLRERISKHIKV